MSDVTRASSLTELLATHPEFEDREAAESLLAQLGQ